MGKEHNGKGLHKNYAETGRVPGVGVTPTREFAKGGFVSSNDSAHKHHGAPLHYKKTVKMKCGGSG